MNHIIDVVWYKMLSNILPLFVWTCVLAVQSKKNVDKINTCTEKDGYICYGPLNALHLAAITT